jgi:hypothetical protein
MLSSDKKPAGRKGSDQDGPVLMIAHISCTGREEKLIGDTNRSLNLSLIKKDKRIIFSI